ncbi:hypothetical protein JHK87_052172 [Glycine soja]|nr:hypothetical protein JHK87_052172 [Glycine soja]
MTVFASLLYQLFASNVNEIGVWSLQGKPLASAWLKETVLKNDLDGQGRIKVDERLRVKGRNNIFAIGDVTDIPKENDWDSLIELAIDALGNKKKQVLQGILEIQKCFRGHQARGYFCELKNEMTTLQSCTAIIRGENTRRRYGVMVKSSITIYSRKLEEIHAIILLQSGWLVTRDASHVNRSKTYPENAKPRRKSFMEIIPEVKDLSKEPVQNLVSALAGLQRRVDKADAIVEQKEEEKAIIVVVTVKDLFSMIGESMYKAKAEMRDMAPLKKYVKPRNDDNQYSQVMTELEHAKRELFQLKLHVGSILEEKLQAENEVKASRSSMLSFSRVAQKLRNKIEEASEEQLVV